MNDYGYSSAQAMKLLEYTDGYQMVVSQYFETAAQSGTFCVKKVGAKNENGGASNGYLCFDWASNLLQSVCWLDYTGDLSAVTPSTATTCAYETSTRTWALIGESGGTTSTATYRSTGHQVYTWAEAPFVSFSPAAAATKSIFEIRWLQPKYQENDYYRNNMRVNRGDTVYGARVTGASAVMSGTFST